MTDITTVSLKTLQEDISSLKNKKVKLKEFAFFVNSTMVHDDYYLQIGPRGGVVVYYGKSKQLNVGHYPFADATPEKGVVINQSGSYYSSNIFPPRKEVPRVLSQAEKCLRETVKQYKKTYDRANERLDKIIELGKEYPEYSL